MSSACPLCPLHGLQTGLLMSFFQQWLFSCHSIKARCVQCTTSRFSHLSCRSLQLLLSYCGPLGSTNVLLRHISEVDIVAEALICPSHAREWQAEGSPSCVRRMYLMQRHSVCVQVCKSVQYQKPLFSKPWWLCLERVLINDCFPVIYHQEDGWSWPVWLEGGETRTEEPGERWGGVRSFLLWTRIGSWVSSEVR